MGLISSMLKQTCVYWPLGNTESGGMSHDAYGKPIYSEPVEISCRWEEKTEKYLNAKGEEVLSNAVVFVAQDVQLSGVLMLGTLDDITDEVNPLENSGAFSIQRFEKLPDLKAREFLRKAFL